MKIERVEFLRCALRLRGDFRTSFGTERDRDIVLVRVHADGAVGYGELVAGTAPLYSEETVETALVILRAHLVGSVLGHTLDHPRELAGRWRALRGNHMAKAALEAAVWDAWCHGQGVSLAQALGGVKPRVAAGVSIGITDTLPTLLDQIESYLAAGYQRIKIKIEPGSDADPVAAIRDAFGDIALTVDANSAYRLADADILARLDDYGLMMIEQPLADDDLVDHAALQAKLTTPICLDESIRSAEHARKALDLGACRIINAKIGRLGGHSETLALEKLCRERGVPLWCGGMLESGVGRLHNIAAASLTGFTLPGDTSASDRYWDRDIIDPAVHLNADGTVDVPVDAGIARRIDESQLRKVTVSIQSLT